MDSNLPGSSVHGISQVRILEWVAISFSMGSSWPMDQTRVFCIAGRFFTAWATREVLYINSSLKKIFFLNCWPTWKKIHSNNFNGWLCVEKHRQERSNQLIPGHPDNPWAHLRSCVQLSHLSAWNQISARDGVCLDAPLVPGLLACIIGSETEQDWATIPFSQEVPFSGSILFTQVWDSDGGREGHCPEGFLILCPNFLSKGNLGSWGTLTALWLGSNHFISSNLRFYMCKETVTPMPCHSNCATHRFTVHSDIFFGVNIIGDPLILGTVGNRAVLGIQQGQKLNDWWEEDNKAISK